MDPKPILLTGASGALGRMLARELGAAGFTLRIDSTRSPPRAGAKVGLHVRPEHVHWFDSTSGQRVG